MAVLVVLLILLMTLVYVVMADSSSVNLNCTTSQGAFAVFTVYAANNTGWTSQFESSGPNPVFANKSGVCTGQTSCPVTHYTTSPGQGKRWIKHSINVVSGTHSRQSTGCTPYFAGSEEQ
jgi:hypothetical protein